MRTSVYTNAQGEPDIKLLRPEVVGDAHPRKIGVAANAGLPPHVPKRHSRQTLLDEAGQPPALFG